MKVNWLLHDLSGYTPSKHEFRQAYIKPYVSALMSLADTKWWND